VPRPQSKGAVRRVDRRRLANDRRQVAVSARADMYGNPLVVVTPISSRPMSLVIAQPTARIWT
jgi:hypothetical protein